MREILLGCGARQTADQTVELRSLRLERSQVIMPTAHSTPSKEVVTAALLVIGGKIRASG